MKTSNRFFYMDTILKISLKIKFEEFCLDVMAFIFKAH